MRGERTPACIDEEIKRQTQKKRVAEFPSEPEQEKKKTQNKFKDAGDVGDKPPTAELLREFRGAPARRQKRKYRTIEADPEGVRVGAAG